MAMDRREFLGAGVGAAAALTGGASLTGTGAWGKSSATLPKRPWKDGVELSVLALGGIVVCKMPQEEASRRVAAAYERGVNYFDCAPSYFDGEAEMKLGKALRPYRNKVFFGGEDAKAGRERGSCGVGTDITTLPHGPRGPVSISRSNDDGRCRQDFGSWWSGRTVFWRKERGEGAALGIFRT